MNRKNFIKNMIMGALGAVAINKTKAHAEISTYDKLIDQVGFNHIPLEEKKTMKTVLHKASSRGLANHGWLKSYHSFSFANYYNPERMNFGVLRVLNDDKVAAGRGFGTHPHDNMEIISIPLEGDLEHKDNMGNVAVIKSGDIQVMSAGTGIQHSEYNKSGEKDVKFLQIWLFPNEKNVKPRYDQIKIDESKMKNNFTQVLSPSPDDEGVWIHQNAWFHLGHFDRHKNVAYDIRNPKNGLYIFVLEGQAKVGNVQLETRDGFGIWETSKVNIETQPGAKILLMDVPMSI